MFQPFRAHKVLKWPTMTLNDVIIGQKSSKLANDISAGNFRTNGTNVRYKQDKNFLNEQICRIHVFGEVSSKMAIYGAFRP